MKRTDHYKGAPSGHLLSAAALILTCGAAANAAWDAPGPLKNVEQFRIASLDAGRLMAEDANRNRAGLAPRFAVPHDVLLTPNNSGEWSALDAETSLWRLRVTSENAKNINLGFTGFELPVGASLQIYGEDGGHDLREFTSADNADHGQLWTPPVNDDEVVIELTVANKVADQVLIELGSINVGYRDFGSLANEVAAVRSGSCNIDVVCPEGDDYADIISTVAVISTGGSTFCTGFMVNNTAQDRDPLFMTADHCGIGAGNAASLVTFWNFENTTCRAPGSAASGGAGDGTLDQFVSGSTFLASNPASDMTIVRLSSAPPAEWEVGYAGWDRRDIDHAGAIAVHHPNTDEKRISFEGDPVVATTYLSDAPPGDGTHYWVSSWDEGTTEPGSSGSPLFSPEGRVIGQLHGGFASCTDFRGDWYGRIPVSWDNGSDSNSLRPWLDPIGSGAEVLDTIPGRGASLDPSAEVVSKGVLGGPFTNPTTVYTLNNSGTSALIYNVTLAAGSTAPVSLSGSTSGSVPQGADVTFSVDLDTDAASALGQGIYTATVEVEDQTNGLTLSRDFRLEVGQTGFTLEGPSFVYGSGPVGGPFTGEQVYTVTSTQPSPVDIEVGTLLGWAEITRGKSGRDTEVISLNGEGDSASFTVGFNASATQLPAGLVNGEITITNLSQDGVGNSSIPVTLDVGRFVVPSGDTPIAITDNATITSEIVFNEAFCVGDVDVSVDVTHTFKGDLRITLISPDGVSVVLHDRSGSSTDNVIEDWDDDTNPVDGPGTLADFNNGSSAGTWTLEISDNANSDVGTLNSWTLELASAGADCPPSADDAFALVLPGDSLDIVLNGTSSVGAPLNYVITSLPASGSLRDNGASINAVPHVLTNDTVTYVADSLFVGLDTFMFQVDDGQVSQDATVTVEVSNEQVVYEFPLDSDPNWIMEGDWAFGQPQGGSGSSFSDAGDPTAGATGDNVLGYAIGAGASGGYDNNMSETNLTSEALDFSNMSQSVLQFQRWLGIESSTFDNAAVQISADDGENWIEVWSHDGTALTGGAWEEVEYDISALDGSTEARIRWVMGSTDSSVTYCGWNIDDIRILASVAPSDSCPIDITGNGSVDIEDLLQVLRDFGTANLGSDTNGDGKVDIEDLLGVLREFGTDCP